jgi:2-polyprenyl-3-methyl-5-hydroxy-6-metoxy-1,4-benzoquinol methylase
MTDLAAAYDADYYASHLGSPYHRGNPEWKEFFGMVADLIVERIHPETALDVGCAIGFLVEELRARGVDAYGIDVSEYAINQVPQELRPYCRVGSVTTAIDRGYDLLTCIEVLEHLPPEEAEAAVANITRLVDAVLFSSTPDDHTEPTHLNVQPPWYWARLFAEHGFLRDADIDVRAVTQHAVLYRRSASMSSLEIIERYERILDHARLERMRTPTTSAPMSLRRRVVRRITGASR